MLRKLMEGTERKYVSLDDIVMRDLAKNDPETFIGTFLPPVFIDEAQYAQTHNKITETVLLRQRISFISDSMEQR